jgi:hypothetical protein
MRSPGRAGPRRDCCSVTRQDDRPRLARAGSPVLAVAVGGRCDRDQGEVVRAAAAHRAGLDSLFVGDQQPGALLRTAVADRIAGGRPKALQNQDCCGVVGPPEGEGNAPAHTLWRRHLTETTARPRAPQPRHLTCPWRSSTLVPGSRPSRRRNSGVSSAT